jgi:hypothetical protein
MDGLVYMDAEITPNRSLSQRGFIVLISVLTTFNCISAIAFVMMGALLVPIFLGLDVAAVVLAFSAGQPRDAEMVPGSLGKPHGLHPRGPGKRRGRGGSAAGPVRAGGGGGPGAQPFGANRLRPCLEGRHLPGSIGAGLGRSADLAISARA